MGIRFACSACGHILNVKSELAGKRGICPKCQARLEIPQESTVERRGQKESPSSTKLGSAGESAVASGGRVATEAAVARPQPQATPVAEPAPSAEPVSAAPVAAANPVAQQPAVAAVSPVAAPGDPISEAPHLLWYVAPAGTSNQYGPASGDMFRSWIVEGRVSPDSLVWRQDWTTWLRAGDVLPQLGHGAPAAALVSSPNLQAGEPVAAAPLPAAPLAAAPVASPVVAQAAPAADAAAAGWSPAQTGPVRPILVAASEPRLKKQQSSSTTILVVGLAIVVVLLLVIVVLLLQR